jgi:hypothetical protein
VGIGDFFPGIKRSECEATTHLHIVPRSKDAWSYNSAPPIRLHGMVAQLKHRGSFTFTFYLLVLVTTIACSIGLNVVNERMLISSESSHSPLPGIFS